MRPELGRTQYLLTSQYLARNLNLECVLLWRRSFDL